MSEPTVIPFGLRAENERLVNTLRKVRQLLDFPHSVAKQATNGKVQYEGDDYWFIMNAIASVMREIDTELKK